MRSSDMGSFACRSLKPPWRLGGDFGGKGETMEKPGLVVLQIKRGDIISVELADLVWLKGNPYARPRPDLGGSTDYIGGS